MHNSDDEAVISNEIQEGLNLFEETFGFKSRSVIPPCFAITDKGLEVLSKSEVKHLQAPLYKHDVVNPSKKERLFTGKRNPQGMFYTVRNVNFEPSLFPNKDWVSGVLKDVYWAFFWGKPAIINSHRLNFIGSLNESNRTKNIQLLTVILKEIIKHWPEVEFVSSDRLSEFYV